MPLYSKPSVRSAWGQTATPADTQDPGDTYTSKGWQIGLKPPRQYFNWLLNYIFAGVRYLCQRGIPDWDANESYATGAVVLTPAGYLSYAFTNNTGQNPDTPANFGVSWTAPFVQTVPNNDASGRIPNTFWVNSYYLPRGSQIQALNGVVSNAQIPASAVVQWQGALSISGSQITSPVANATQVSLGNGHYSALNYSGQGGQPSWLFGSNDGQGIFVWNPANFNVNSANFLQGIGPSITANGSSVPIRDGSGDLFARYFNSGSASAENPSIGNFMVTNPTDGYLRKSSPTSVVAGLQAVSGWLTSGSLPASLAVNGYQRLPSGVIIQWGQASVSGPTFVSFPTTFPTRVTSVVFSLINSTNQLFLNGQPGAQTGFNISNGTGLICWQAIGY